MTPPNLSRPGLSGRAPALMVFLLCMAAGNAACAQSSQPGFLQLVPGISVKPVLHMLSPERTSNPAMKTYTVNLEYYPEYAAYYSLEVKRVEVTTDIADSISEVRLVLPARYKYETIHNTLTGIYGFTPCIFSLPKKEEIYCLWQEQHIFLTKVARSDEKYQARCYYVVFSRGS